MPKKIRIALIGIDHPHGMGWRESITHVFDELEVSAIVPALMARRQASRSAMPLLPVLTQ